MSNARDLHEYRYKWGKIGQSRLLSEHGDLSVFIVCFETVLAREHSGKVLQNSTASFISEESKKWKTVFCPEIFRVRLHRFFQK